MTTQGSIRAGGRFGRLAIDREVGSGAFGRVYRAHDPLIGRAVALKVLKGPAAATPSLEERERFLAEAKTMGALTHPHVVTLYQVHETEDGGFALELEYAEGGTLDDLLGERTRVPVEQAASIARDVAAALAAAHGAHIVHGDVKPGNVLLTKDGRVKLTDFGLARLLGAQEPAGGRLGIAGTPYYMAPEVIQGEPMLPASDVWSLGVLLHRMLAGVLPFAKDDLNALFVSIQHEPAPPLGPEVPEDLARVVERCLAKRPGDRFSDGAALSSALERPEAARGAPEARPRPAPSVARLFGRATEAAQVVGAIERLEGGKGALLVATGPAGIGKSALFLAGVEEARRRGLRVATASVSPVEGLVRPLSRAVRSLSTAFGEPAGEADDDPAAARTLLEVERSLSSLAAERPAAVLLEDLHHATTEEVKGLVRLCRRLAAAPLLWLFSERTSDLGLAGSHSAKATALLEIEGAERLEVGPLSSEAVSRLLDEVAEGVRLSGEVLDRLVHRSGGNPFFALQWFHHLRETGVIARTGSEWSLLDPAAASAPPPALTDLVSRRLRGLSEGARSLLDVAAVDGMDFDGEAVAAVYGRPLLAVLRTLQTLCRVQGLVAPRDRGYRFAHPLLHEVLYEEVSPELRREIHRRLAEHLAARGDGVDPERLGTHFERAGDRSRAAPLLLRAARDAGMRQENLRAIDLAARAGVVADRIDAAVVRRDPDALLAIAACLGDLGRTAEAERYYASFLEVAEAAGDEILRLRVLVRRAMFRHLGAGLKAGDEEDVRRAAERLPAGEELGRARYVLGLIGKYHGDLPGAERWLKGADDLFVETKNLGWHGSATDQLASIAVRFGRVEEGERLYAEAARACRRAGRNSNAGVSEVNRAMAGVLLGRLEGQDERIRNAIAAFTADGSPKLAGQARAVLADVLWSQGDPRRAREALDASLDSLHSLGFQVGLVQALRLDAEMRIAAGDFRGAARSLADLRARADRVEDPESGTIAKALESRLLLAIGRVAEGEAKAREAMERVGGIDSRARVEVAVVLFPGVFCGLSAAALEAARALLPDAAGPPGSPPAKIASDALLGAIAYARTEAPAADLDAAARALVSERVGGRRAMLQVAGHLFRGEAARRSRDPVAVDAFRAALDASRSLEDALLEMESLRRLRLAVPSGPWAALLCARVAEVASRVEAAPDAAALRAAWR